MDKIASAKWVSELEMEDPAFLNQYETNFADHTTEDLNFLSFSFKSYSAYPNLIPDDQNGTDQRPAEQPKNNHSNLNTCTNTVSSPRASLFVSSSLISFDNSNSSPVTTSLYQHYGIQRTTPVKLEMGSYGELDFISKDDYVNDLQTCSPKPGQGIKRATRSPLHAQEHVIAEKKRRENLSQQFIALSALLPGLKKINKATVLDEATKYMKHLQERMKILEEQASKKTEKSVVLVRRTQYSSVDDDDSSPDESSSSFSDRRLPEIEARFLGREVLIRIHCEKKKVYLPNILSEIETLDLTIVNTSVLPFGNSTINISVVSQMSVEFSMTVKELVRNLKQALLILA